MIFDSHIHTEVSSDSKMNIKDAIEQANKLSLGLIITEHMDVNFPVEGEFIFDTKDFFNKYGSLRRDNLLLGIELGLRSDALEKNIEISKEADFDYILGSVHFVNGLDMSQKSFYEGRTKEEAYLEYLNTIKECVKEGDFFHSLGHIDYISRYSSCEDKEIYYEDFKESIDEILSIISKKEKAMEINTRRLGDENAVQNLTKIYKTFKEQGGKYVTIGSDSHNSASIGKNFNIAFEMAEFCDLKPVYFKNGNMEYMK